MTAPFRGVPFDPPAPVAQVLGQYLWQDGTVRDGITSAANIINASVPELVHTNLLASCIFKLTSVLGTDKAVPSSLTVAGHSLSGNVTIAVGDISGVGTLASLNAAPAGTLTGTTLAANVVTSSLTSVGTLSAGSIPYSLVTGGPAAVSGANPTATIGTAAVNGTAATFMRSDAAPAFGNLTGDVTSAGMATTLANTAVTAGSYTIASITVDAKGRLTAASTGYTVSGTGTVLMATASPTTTGTFTGAAANWSGQNTFSVAGVASVPALTVSGTPFAGTGTTSFPQVYINQSTATASTTLSTSGTLFGINSHGAVDLINLMTDGVTQLKLSSTLLDVQMPSQFNGGMTLLSPRVFSVNSGALIAQVGTGVAFVRLNSAGSNYGKIQNDAANTWSLAYSAGSDTTLGTPAITWTATNGFVGINKSTSLVAQLEVDSSSLSTIGIISQSAASATANKFEGRKSDATVECSIGPTGYPKWPGSTYLAADVTNATATMANIKKVADCISGVNYFGYVAIPANDSQATEGLQFDFNGGSATFSAVDFGIIGVPLGATLGVAYSTALGTAVTVTTATTADVQYFIVFSGICNGSGTLIVRGAQVSHTLGTATFRAGATGNIQPCN